MHSTLKRVGCFALVLVLIFTIFAQPLAPKAEAAVIELTAGAFSSILILLGMIGITFLTVEAGKAAVNAFVESEPDILEGPMGDWLKGDWGDEPNPPGGNRPPNLWLDGSATAFVVDLLNRLRSFFGGKDKIEVEDKTMGLVGNIQFTRLTSFSSPEHAFAIAPYSYKQYTRENPLRVAVNGVPYDFSIGKYSANSEMSMALFSTIYSVEYVQDRMKRFNYWTWNNNQLPGFKEWVDVRFGFWYSKGETDYLVPYLAYKWVTNEGLIYTGYLQYPSSNFSVPISGKGISPVIYGVPYNNKSGYSISSIRDGIINKITASPGPIVIDKTQVIDAIETDNDEKLQEETDQKKLIDMIPGLKDILEDIRDNQPEPEADFVPPELPGGDLSEKFPFCVPFDLFRLVKALNAPPVAPRWEIPVHFPIINYEDKIVLDLGEFEILAIPIRWGLTLIYLLGLIVVSRKMIKG